MEQLGQMREVTDRLLVLAAANPDDLRAGARALRLVGKRWIVEGGTVTPDDDHEANRAALEQGDRLYELAEALEKAQGKA